MASKTVLEEQAEGLKKLREFMNNAVTKVSASASVEGFVNATLSVYKEEREVNDLIKRSGGQNPPASD